MEIPYNVRVGELLIARGLTCDTPVWAGQRVFDLDKFLFRVGVPVGEVTVGDEGEPIKVAVFGRKNEALAEDAAEALRREFGCEVRVVLQHT